MYSTNVSRADPLAHLRPVGVHRVGERVRGRDGPELLAAGVLERHAADRLRRGGVDRRVRRDLPAVERRRGGHDLEGRAGRVQLLGRPVEERLVRRSLFSWPICDGIRFGSYSGIDTITRTLPVDGSIATTAPFRPARPFDRRLGALQVEVRDDVVALAVAALEPGQDRRELVLLADQVLVPARLEAALAVRQVREADRMGEQAALSDRCACTCGSRRARGRGCAPAPSGRRRRGSGRAGSSAPRSAAAGCPGCPSSELGLEHGPARGEDDQDREQEREQPEQLDDLAVHGARPALPAARASARARSETIRSSASSTMFATIELPP